MKTNEIKIDTEFHELISPLTNTELTELEASLKSEGCREPLICWNNLILDGHNRYEICNQSNIPFEIKTIELIGREAAMEWIITNQLARRNISIYQRGRLAMKRSKIVEARAKERMLAGKSNPLQNSVEGHPLSNTTNFQLAKVAGVGHDSIHKIRVIEKEASQEAKNKLMAGTTSINAEYTKLRPPKDKMVAKPDKTKRIEQIRLLSANGFRAEQIAVKIGQSPDYTRELAKKAGIVLPDAITGPSRKIDVNRILRETAATAQSLTAGLEFIDSRMANLEGSQIEGWITIFKDTVSKLNHLINQLKRRIKANE